MRIRAKIILTVLPLLVVTLVLSGVTSSLSARSGITRIAMDFLSYKANDLRKYMDNQWSILSSNNLASDPEFVEISQRSVASYAKTLVRSPTERVFALDGRGEIVMTSDVLELDATERDLLLGLVRTSGGTWIERQIAGQARVGQSFLHEPMGWAVFVTEELAVFYREVNEISVQAAVILGVSCLVAVFLLLLFSAYITRPLTRVVQVMRGIIGSSDLSQRVDVEYRDETGDLAHTFNIMVGELEKATTHIKNYAYRALLAKHQEQEIRNIFQKYVPADVIDRIFRNPESMLVGENRPLAVLFSDIRSFTTIAEGQPPDQLVASLNRYFSRMVDIIMKRRGIVDKYIGDAIMAFYGAPVRHPDDALQSVLSALEMQEALVLFNEEEAARSRKGFRIGIGIAFGEVTVGNIGSERKMDYTVIGDMVNLASRLESLTKKYHETLLFSESVHAHAHDAVRCRLVDRVAVKGRTTGEPIYTARRTLSTAEEQGWDLHARAVKLYYDRDFPGAREVFRTVRDAIPDDPVAAMFLDRCDRFEREPPPAEWAGVEVMEEK
jgi:class 3 adenylate cyclase/HAMP domain-containing protein